MLLRKAVEADGEHIVDVYRSAFPRGEAGPVAKLAVDLLAEEATPPVLSLIAEEAGVVVGHVAFSPVTIEGEDTPAAILAPLAVREDVRKRGIGSRLVEDGLGALTERGVDLVFVYGDPAYYGRFGFQVEAAAPYLPPCELEYPFGWQLRTKGKDAVRNDPVGIRCVDSLSDPALW